MPLVERSSHVQMQNCVKSGVPHNGKIFRRVTRVTGFNATHRGLKILVEFEERPRKIYNVSHEDLHHFYGAERAARDYLLGLALSLNHTDVWKYYHILHSKCRDLVVHLRNMRDDEFR